MGAVVVLSGDGRDAHMRLGDVNAQFLQRLGIQGRSGFFAAHGDGEGLIPEWGERINRQDLVVVGEPGLSVVDKELEFGEQGRAPLAQSQDGDVPLRQHARGVRIIERVAMAGFRADDDEGVGAEVRRANLGQRH